ncbi:DUF4861 family protein [Simiduia agarivorans]|uniref:Unsaturated rhamnogalacturonyl hydrolase urh105A n=1 Tax=Simiduia agarivorans (strain DSM 21679 / JCM 13881 / BCRC 17597 / SA1) TaxID=1117647 RepID=K4KJT5_SIMAS|nr:DUF4861 family protein [Simiduia agarivorans]AFU99246.2 unsaturated rhamnogalacturonyl hydrolase urh105A [Simiduia agarivorans SA1 = DSM 21679]
MRYFLVVALAITLAACGAERTQDQPQKPSQAKAASLAEVRVSNAQLVARNSEILMLDFERLGATQGPLSAWHEGAELPSQLVDRDADGRPDALAVSIDLAAAAQMNFSVAATPSQLTAAARTQAEISRKQGGQWQGKQYQGGEFINVPRLKLPRQYTDHSEYIRYEGPGIESDHIGYRVYLDWRNGFDIFGKRESDLVLQQVGLDGYDSYHQMADWGMDLLKVGQSLGMGGFGYWDGKNVVPVGHTSSREAIIIDKGPLLSSFVIDYGSWQVDGVTTNLRAQFTMTAGSPLVQVKLQLSEPVHPLVIGLVKSEAAPLVQGDDDITGHAYTAVSTWGKQSLAGDDLGMMLVFKNALRTEQTEDDKSWLSVMRAPSGQLEYYFGAIWSGGPAGIADKIAFEAAVAGWSDRLTFAPRVDIVHAGNPTVSVDSLTADTVLSLARDMADTELRTKAWPLRYGGWDPERDRPAKWEYTTGLLAQAFDDLAQAGLGQNYAAAGADLVGSFVAPDGQIHTYKLDSYNIDNINAGKMLLRLYQQTGEPRFATAAAELRKQLATHPKTSNGAFWHKKKYPGQLWLDGVYMGMPFLAQYSLMFEQGASLNEAVHEFDVVNEKLKAANGLLHHAWDEERAQTWADQTTGLSPEFWSRGMGWYAMALVDLLEILPDDKVAERERLTAYLVEFLSAIKPHRSPAGVWYQVMDKPNAPGNYEEASASSMFVYALAKGINLGVLPESYRPYALASYQGVVNQFVSRDPDGDVHINNICQVAGLGFGRDGSYRYYMSEPVVADDIKGLAPFLMASVQISRLLQ